MRLCHQKRPWTPGRFCYMMGSCNMSYLVAMNCRMKVWQTKVHHVLQPVEAEIDFRATSISFWQLIGQGPVRSSLFTCDGHLDIKVYKQIEWTDLDHEFKSIPAINPSDYNTDRISQRLINIHVFITFLYSLYFQGYSYFKVIFLKALYCSLANAIVFFFGSFALLLPLI